MTGKQATKHLVAYLKKKEKLSGIFTQEGFGKAIGVCHMSIYVKLKTNNWSKTDREGIGQIMNKDGYAKMDFLLFSNKELTAWIKNYLALQQIQKKEKTITRKKVADKLGLPISTLYYRMTNHNWKESEINLIKKL